MARLEIIYLCQNNDYWSFYKQYLNQYKRVNMGIIERKEREKIQRKNDIINAAEEVFFSKGINFATMDDVAEKAELSKGTIYLYFKNKEELYLAIACRALEILYQMFEKATAKEKIGLHKVRAIGQAYYQYSNKYSNYFHTILHYEVSRFDSALSAPMLDECHKIGQKVMQQVAAAIETGIHDKSIRADLNPIRTAYLLNGASSGVIRLIAREKDHIKKFEDFKPEDLHNDFMNMMFHALQSEHVK
jgi:TetR/AcrR family transcriptional regulator